ncbi:MAG: hypothetical protein J6O04_00510 [Selenomonadaceae bacterium]|nr:hypothetical protein [Selenomonadaceae bacterium]
MIMTLEDYYIKRYQGIEREFLDKTSAYLNENTEKILECLVKNTTEILKKALNIQNERDISCGYMSFSLLLTSVMVNKPVLQVDFYSGEWVYSEPWGREKIDASFLFRYWDDLQKAAFDDDYFMRSRITSAMIKTFFYDTLDELIYVLADYLKKYGENFANIPEFSKMKKETPAYITVGAYLDWQERIFAVEKDEK